MTTDTRLRRFVRDQRDTLVLSVYVDSRPQDPATAPRMAAMPWQALTPLRERIASQPREERDLFERLAAIAMERLEAERNDAGTASLACFVAAGGQVLLLHLPPGAGTSAHWEIGPAIIPYVRVAGPEEALIAQVDLAHARLTQWVDGRLVPLLDQSASAVHGVGTHMSEPPRLGFHVGTRGPAGTDVAKQHRQHESARLLHALVDRLAAVPGPALPIVVGGGQEAVARLLKALPASLVARSSVAHDLRMDPPDGALPIIRSTLASMRASRARQRAAELREQAYAAGHAARGLDAAMRAATDGAIAELLLSDRDWRGHPVEVGRLVKQAMLEGARLDWIPLGPDEALAPGEDIVAGLRFAVSPAAAAS